MAAQNYTPAFSKLNDKIPTVVDSVAAFGSGFFYLTLAFCACVIPSVPLPCEMPLRLSHRGHRSPCRQLHFSLVCRQAVLFTKYHMPNTRYNKIRVIRG